MKSLLVFFRNINFAQCSDGLSCTSKILFELSDFLTVIQPGRNSISKA